VPTSTKETVSIQCLELEFFQDWEVRMRDNKDKAERLEELLDDWLDENE
jgi:hypothetical protein